MAAHDTRIGLGLLAGLIAAPASAEDLAAARQLFLTSCGVCHTVERGAAPRQGPSLLGVYGRAAGALPEFSYSTVLKAGGWTWTEETLDPWLENAQAAHPGTTMNYRQRDPEKRELIIEFLKSVSGGAQQNAAGPQD